MGHDVSEGRGSGQQAYPCKVSERRCSSSSCCFLCLSDSTRFHLQPHSRSCKQSRPFARSTLERVQVLTPNWAASRYYMAAVVQSVALQPCTQLLCWASSSHAPHNSDWGSQGAMTRHPGHCLHKTVRSVQQQKRPLLTEFYPNCVCL